jgi:hypothetical protein
MIQESHYLTGGRAWNHPGIAAGNNHYNGFINYPACIPSAYSIGAVNYVNNKPEIVSFPIMRWQWICWRLGLTFCPQF